MMSEQLEERCRNLVSKLPGLNENKIQHISALSGGVSSDILVVEMAERKICVKFALEQLKVAEEWRAPVQRNMSEYRWLEAVGRFAPDSVPQLYGYSQREKGFAMEFLEGEGTYLWKSSMLKGASARGEAVCVARLLGRIHAKAARDDFDKRYFNNHMDFKALRLDPYLSFTTRHHPSVAKRLEELAESLLQSSITLIHGDVSPKNILFHHDMPVLLDAECATMGDPCFDVAFCLNHLLLKWIHLVDSRDDLLSAANEFIEEYLQCVDWEAQQALDTRVAALLPALMLARVDGKSPVEYLTSTEQQQVRELSLPLIQSPLPSVAATLATLSKQVP